MAASPFDPEEQSRALLRAEGARIERAARFARARVEAILTLLVDAPKGPALDSLLARLERLEKGAREADQVVKSAAFARTETALAQLKSFDYGGLLAAIRGLEAEATALMAAGPARPRSTPRPATRPLTSPPARSSVAAALTDRLRAFAAVLAPVTRPLPEKVRPPAADRVAMEGLVATLTLVGNVLAYVTPRMEPVACALDVGEGPRRGMTALVAAGKKAAETEVDAEMQGWVTPLVKLFALHPIHRRPARVAETQWRQAAELHLEGEIARDVAADASPEQRAKVLDSVRAAKLRGAIMPLGNLHMTFSGIPHLQELFPPPASRG